MIGPRRRAARAAGLGVLLLSFHAVAAQTEIAKLAVEVDSVLTGEAFDVERSHDLLDRCRAAMREQSIEPAFHWRPAMLALRLAQLDPGLDDLRWRALMLEAAELAARIGSPAHEEELRLTIAQALLQGGASGDAVAVLAPLDGATTSSDPVAVQTLLAVALDQQDEIAASRAALELARAAVAARPGGGNASGADLVHRVASTLALASGDPVTAQREFDRIRDASPVEREQHELAMALATEDFVSARAAAERLMKLSQPMRDLAVFHGIQARRRLGESPTRLDQELADLAVSAPRALSRFVAVERASMAVDQADFERGSELLAAGTPEFDRLRARPLDLAWVTTRARLELGRRGSSEEDFGVLRAVRGDLEAVWSSLRRRWLAMPLRRDGLAFLQFGQRRDVAGLLIALDVRLDGPRVALRRVLEMEAQDSLVRSLWHGVVVDAESLSEVVPEHGGVLMYLGAPSGSHVFALSSARLVHASIDADPALYGEAREHSMALAEATIDDSSLREQGARLMARLVPPTIREQLATWDELAVVGGEWVGSPAFEAFEFDGEWWGCRFAITHYPSLTGAVAMARAKPTIGLREGVAIVAASEPSARIARAAGLREIPAAVDFIDAMRESLGEESVRAVAGREATAEALRRLAAEQSALVVVAHGADATTPPFGTGLLLADGLLGGEELSQVPMPPIVLCMSCRAAAGLRRGESVAPHLGGAIFRAGARTFAMADHDLLVEPTLRFAAELTRSLTRTEGRLAHAARAARRALLQQNSGNCLNEVMRLVVRGSGFERNSYPRPRPPEGEGNRLEWILALVVSGVLFRILWKRNAMSLSTR
ncbi:MAG: CHAT domain-containing protein [Planctomycetota bacterium]